MLGYEFLEIILKKNNNTFDKNFDYFIKSLNNHQCNLKTLYKYAVLYKINVSIDFSIPDNNDDLLGTHLRKLLIRKNTSLKNTANNLNLSYESLINRLKRINSNSFKLNELLFVTSNNSFQSFLIISNKTETTKINLENPYLGDEILKFLKESNYDLNKIRKYHFLSENNFNNLFYKINEKRTTYNTLNNFFKFDKNIFIKIEILNFHNNINESLDKKFKHSINLKNNKEIAEKLNISYSQVTNFFKNLNQHKIQLNKLFFYANKLKINIKIKFQ